MGMLTKAPWFDFHDVFDHLITPHQLLARDDKLNKPSIDVTEEKNRYVVKADLPGIKKEDIKVLCEHGILTIETEFNQETKEEHEGKILRQERRFGKYMRNLYLGDNIEKDKIDATFTDGVLTLTVTKKEADVDNDIRQIEIH